MRERKPYERYASGKFLGWYIRWDGKQTWLGRDRAEAHENWNRLKCGLRIIREGRFAGAAAHPDPTMRETADAFLASIKANRKKSESTWKWYGKYLDSLCEHSVEGLKVQARCWSLSARGLAACGTATQTIKN